MPVVTVDLWEGKNIEQKRKLVESITKAVVDSIGCSSAAVVQVIIRDVPKHNWAIGGKLCSETK